VLSPSWRARLSPFVGRARVLVIPNGVALPAHEPHAKEDEPPPSTSADRAGRAPCRFLFLGPLTEPKGLGDLIEAASLLEQGEIPFHLLIAGPAAPADRSAWEQRITEAGLAQSVTFHGPVQGVERDRLFVSVDCLVHPSHSEGLPFSILEAAAAGLPVIATAVGDVPDVLMLRPPRRSRFRERLAPLVPPHDPATLARQMTSLALDEPLRRRIGQALRSHVAENYDIDQQARRVARLYESILPRRLSRRGPGDEPRTSVCGRACAGLRSAAHTGKPSSEHRSPDAGRPEPAAIAPRH
jgi:glycosyltransferase involved in cell wall biosynthesis